MKLKFTACAIILASVSGFGQKIDNTASFRDMNSDSYFRFNYDNDFFSSSDQYYTQGYNFEFASPRLKKNPLNFFLLRPESSAKKYILALEHIGFTPTSILSDAILYGDRPFAAAIMLKSAIITTDTIHHSRLTTSINIGIIGPGAFGGDTQAVIHRWTGNPEPHGWQNQIKNDVVLNYELFYEKQLLRIERFASLQLNATARAGTLFTNASVGFNSTVGIIGGPFSGHGKKFSCYIYAQPLVNVIGYDATLQGGIFNRKSPYTIPDSDIERLTAQINFGAVITFRQMFLEYSRVKITREFSTGSPAKWGGIKIGVKL
ncbi:MAG: lipid A deacylase LpxR family protein [Flavobacterium sp.]|nr:MAG: lipid A deacylase LpxR family protein [Flavobacterium sp.]